MGSVAHHHADVVIITSDSPLSEEPHLVIDDIIAGFPEEVLSRSSLWVHSPWQDPGRVPWWFEEWLFRAQKEIKRHIVEDRSLAIRGAIGTAKKGDVVVIAGRGEQDFMWWVDKDDKPIKTWYEDRMEVRDALIKLPHLRKSKVVTDQLPWNEPEDVSESKLKA